MPPFKPCRRNTTRVLTQSSDNKYHCFTVTLFLAGDPTAYLAEVPVPFRSAVVVPQPGR